MKKPDNSSVQSLWRTRELISVLLVGEGLAVVLSLTPGTSINDRWIYFGLSSLLIQWIALLSLGALFILRHKINTLNINSLLYCALAILLLCTWAVGTAAWWFQTNSLGINSSLFSFLGKISAIALVVGALSCAAYQNHWQAQQMAVKAKQSELDALQARIQPHFLFNTLNTGAALVHQRPAEAEQLLLDLSELFRAALSNSKLISLEEELLLARRYLEIESLRFGDRLKIDWRLPEMLPTILLPTLSIQPLVENAVRHGIEPNAEGGDIKITVEAVENLISIKVDNSLPKTSYLSRTGHQIGISSTRERIENYSQGKGRLLTEIKNGRFEATIFLPNN